MIVLFDDDSNYRSKLEQFFMQNNIPFKGWSDYTDIERRLREAKPQVALLDIQIGTELEAGLSALRIIKEKFPNIRIIILSGHADYVFKAFRLGADGYLLKEELPDSIEFIQEALKGYVPMSYQVRRVLRESLQPFEKLPDDMLNTRELEIIFLAASDKTGPQIASTLGLTSQTIQTYLRNIRGKLDCHTIQGVVAKAFYYGIIDKYNFPS